MKSRVALVSVAVAGALGLAVATAGAANAETIATGTGTLTASASYLGTLARSLVVVVPTGAQSYTYTPGDNSLSVTYAATSGDADLNNFAGSVQYSGGLTFADLLNGKQVAVTDLKFDLFNDQVDGTVNGTEVALFDVAGTDTVTINGTTQSLTDPDLQVSSDGAGYLDSALHTKVFTAGAQVGSFATTFSS